MSDIISFDSIKKGIDKYDALTTSLTPNINNIFDNNNVSDRMKRFFDVADGNSIWNER